MKKLPNKPSRLIYLAIEDLEIAEKSKDYEIDMGVFHIPNGKCSVCFAGAVMAGTLECNKSEFITPDNFESDLGRQLNSLDFFRMGAISSGLNQTGLSVPEYMETTSGRWREDIVHYGRDKNKFKEDMLALAGTLDLVGL